MKDMEKISAEVKQLARDNRMDLVGIACESRWADAPEMISPRAHLPNAKTVIAYAIRYPYAMFNRAGRAPAASMMSIEIYQNKVIGNLLYRAGLRIARFLEDQGYEAKPMSVSGKWRIDPYKDIDTDWCSDFSNRHAAVAAGLGTFGLHALTITPQFGTKQRFCSVITDAPLVADPMYSGAPLCDKCMACVNICPVKAINPDKVEKLKIAGEDVEYAKVDHWRCGWSEQTNMVAAEGPKYFGQEANVMPPEEGEITHDMLLDAWHKKNEMAFPQAEFGSHAMGSCMRVCNPPHLRGQKKHPQEALTAAPY